MSTPSISDQPVQGSTMVPHIVEPLLIVISGPSGVGKDSIIEYLKTCSLPFHFVVTATTRPPREEEVHGKDYFFVSHAEFARMIDNNDLIEYAFVYNDYKGIPKSQVDQALASSQDVMMRLDVQGAATIRRLYKDAVLIFLSTRSEEELVARLVNRQTESKDALDMRIAMARKELERVSEFDYLVYNDDQQIEKAAKVILSIIEAEHHRVIQRKVK